MIEDLVVRTDSKILLVVLDGVGGVPVSGETELESARSPNLDNLAKESITGLTEAISPGITPGSGPAHLSLFGYNPIKYQIGRGVLEALGVGVELGSDDVAARGNFATIDANGIVIDRRAGRISTEENKRICDNLQQKIPKIEDVKVELTPGKEHRFVYVLKGESLSDCITETDPQKTGISPSPCTALTPKAEKTAKIVNLFVERARTLLKPPANMVLFRGFAKLPTIPSMQERFKLTPAVIATYPMYKGLAKLVGMEILDVGHNKSSPYIDIEDEVRVLESYWDKYDFFYFHVKKIDSLGEDGNFDAKVREIEEVDKYIPRLVKLNPDVLVVTGDHSTPSLLRAHSWHPNPFLLYSKWAIPDSVTRFTERECMRGGLSRFNAIHVLPLMLAHSLKLKKFRA